MSNTNLSAPWNTYQKKLRALFENDPEIDVLDLMTSSKTNFDYSLEIDVSNHEKYNALVNVLPDTVNFGNVDVEIRLVDNSKEAEAEVDYYNLYKTLFKDNPIVSEVIKSNVRGMSNNIYVLFKPEVVQFFNDNLDDFEGNWTGLAQNIAMEVFDKHDAPVHFCTARKVAVEKCKCKSCDDCKNDIPEEDNTLFKSVNEFKATITNMFSNWDKEIEEKINGKE